MRDARSKQHEATKCHKTLFTFLPAPPWTKNSSWRMLKNKTGMLDMLHAVSEMQNKLRERGAYLVVDEFDHPLWQALGISYDDIILTDELSLSTAQARKLVELIESRKLTLKKLAYLLPYCGPADDAVVRLLEWRQDFLSMLKKSIASCSPLGVFDENIG